MAGATLSVQQDGHGTVTAGTVTPFVRRGDAAGPNVLYLSVEGVHCAGCIHKIESALLKFPEVAQARLNFSTKRLHLAWNGAEDMADRFTRTVSDLGYRVTPFDPDAAMRRDDGHTRFLLLCLGVAGFAAGNIMLMSFALWTTSTATMGPAMRDFLHLVSALIAVPTVVFSGRPFFLSAWKALSSRRTNMDVPISVGLILTTGMSCFELLNHGEHVYFDSVVMLTFFLLIGRYLDDLARSSARRAAGDLIAMMAGAASVVENGKIKSVLIRELREGMTASVAMGERIPADGVVESGASEIDCSLVTGETLPQPVGPGDPVYGGTVNMAAPLLVKIRRQAEDSLLGEIIRLMEKAEQGQARYVRIADRAAKLYTPVVHALALLAFLGWIFIGGLAWQPALMIAVTVLIITCPCALALAVPVVQVLAVSRLMRRGIMVKGGDVLERLAGVDTVIFDKTGTLTLGHPALVNGAEIAPQDIQLAASLAARSRHPLSRALTQAYKGDLLDIDVREIPGAGLEAVVQGRRVRLGSRDWCGLADDGALRDTLEIVLAKEGAEPILFFFRDQPRSDAADVVHELEGRGIKVMLLSGDCSGIVENIARDLGIAQRQGQMTPDGKYKILEDLHAAGHRVLMVGDGLNDAPVLAGADVSMSPSTAIGMAQNAAQIVFTGEALAPVITAIDTARFSQKLVRQNFIMTILYNLIAVPVAVAGFVTPLVAAVAMSLSSLCVTLNAFRLRRRV